MTTKLSITEEYERMVSSIPPPEDASSTYSFMLSCSLILFLKRVQTSHPPSPLQLT